MICHSKHSLKEKVLASSLGGSKGGAVVECQQCHLPQYAWNYLINKIIVSKRLKRLFTIDNCNTQAWLDKNRKAQQISHEITCVLSTLQPDKTAISAL
jgi:cytochrome c-type protein NapC